MPTLFGELWSTNGEKMAISSKILILDWTDILYYFSPFVDQRTPSQVGM